MAAQPNRSLDIAMGHGYVQADSEVKLSIQLAHYDWRNRMATDFGKVANKTAELALALASTSVRELTDDEINEIAGSGSGGSSTSGMDPGR